jgi:hypothetical protein
MQAACQYFYVIYQWDMFFILKLCAAKTAISIEGGNFCL